MNLKFLLFTVLMLSHSAFAKETVTIFAAASLTSPLQEIAHQIEKTSPVKIILSFASSSTLARQITQGAPADLYLSANSRWVDYLEKDAHLQPASRKALLKNRLVIASQRESAIPYFEFSPALVLSNLPEFSGRIAVGDPQHVPVGIYAKEALEKVNLWHSWKDKLAPTNSARSALALTERGETLLGIHYYTDVSQNPKLKVLSQIPSTLHSPIIYEVAMLNRSTHNAVSSVYHYLFSQEAASVFERFGFSTSGHKK